MRCPTPPALTVSASVPRVASLQPLGGKFSRIRPPAAQSSRSRPFVLRLAAHPWDRLIDEQDRPRRWCDGDGSSDHGQVTAITAAAAIPNRIKNHVNNRSDRDSCRRGESTTDSGSRHRASRLRPQRLDDGSDNLLEAGPCVGCGGHCSRARSLERRRPSIGPSASATAFPRPSSTFTARFHVPSSTPRTTPPRRPNPTSAHIPAHARQPMPQSRTAKMKYLFSLRFRIRGRPLSPWPPAVAGPPRASRRTCTGVPQAVAKTLLSMKSAVRSLAPPCGPPATHSSRPDYKTDS